MSRSTSFFVRLVGFLILVGLLAAGGAMLYRFGQAQGYAMGQAASLDGGTPSPENIIPNSSFPPAYYPYYRPHFGFFPFGGILGLIFFGFLFFFALRLLFRPHFWGYPGYRRGDRPWYAHHHHWEGSPWTKDQPSSYAGDQQSQPPASSPTGGAEA
jgi:hypothetical protein